MSDLRDDIAHLEERIEALREATARCAKISLAAKLAIACGAVWTALTVAAAVPFFPSAFFGSLAAIIGGIVMLGSNKTTWEQTLDALREAEAMRAQFIGSIPMRVVGEQRPTLH